MIDLLDFGRIHGVGMHQYWDIYFVVNQQMKTVADLWDGKQLRCDFRRTFTPDMMDM
jgi:hypothetical protein